MALDYEISSVRLTPSDDQSHLHVELIGYDSPHTPGEPIMIGIRRALEKMAFDEKFHITVDGEHADVTEGKCFVCGFAPYLVTSKDDANNNRLLDLPGT